MKKVSFLFIVFVLQGLWVQAQDLNYFWLKGSGDSSRSEVNSMAAFSGNKLMIAGTSGRNGLVYLVDQDTGEPAWSLLCRSDSMAACYQVINDGRGTAYVLGVFKKNLKVGTFNYTSQGNSWFTFLMRVKLNGVVTQQDVIAFKGIRGSKLQYTPKDKLLIGGVFSGDADIIGMASISSADDDVFLLQLTPQFAFNWIKTFPSPGINKITALHVKKSGEIVLSGTLESAIEMEGVAYKLPAGSGQGIFIASADTGGSVRSSVMIDGKPGGKYELRSICSGPDGSLYAAATYTKDWIWGGDTYPCTSLQDALLMKIPKGSPKPEWKRPLKSEDSVNISSVIFETGSVFALGSFTNAAGLVDKKFSCTMSGANPPDCNATILCRLSVDGNILNAEQTTGSDNGGNCLATNGKQMFAGGSYQGIMSLGQTSLQGDRDERWGYAFSFGLPQVTCLNDTLFLLSNDESYTLYYVFDCRNILISMGYVDEYGVTIINRPPDGRSNCDPKKPIIEYYPYPRADVVQPNDSIINISICGTEFKKCGKNKLPLTISTYNNNRVKVKKKCLPVDETVPNNPCFKLEDKQAVICIAKELVNKVADLQKKIDTKNQEGRLMVTGITKDIMKEVNDAIAKINAEVKNIEKQREELKTLYLQWITDICKKGNITMKANSQDPKFPCSTVTFTGARWISSDGGPTLFMEVDISAVPDCGKNTQGAMKQQQLNFVSFQGLGQNGFQTRRGRLVCNPTMQMEGKIRTVMPVIKDFEFSETITFSEPDFYILDQDCPGSKPKIVHKVSPHMWRDAILAGLLEFVNTEVEGANILVSLFTAYKEKDAFGLGLGTADYVTWGASKIADPMADIFGRRIETLDILAENRPRVELATKAYDNLKVMTGVEKMEKKKFYEKIKYVMEQRDILELFK